MADESPAAILFDAAGNPLAPPSGTALPVGQGAVLVAGKDPVGDAQSVAVDTSGRPIIVGAGIAGTPTGGVASIQGVVGGTPMPITGSISATVVEADVGMIGVLAPTSASHTAGVDGAGLLQSERVHDLDTGGGTEFNLGASIRLPSLGGSVAGGTAVNPLRTDPTGTTTQPISAASLPLPTGAATEATLATRAGEHVTAVSSHAARLTDGAAFYKATTPFDTQPVSAVSLPLPTGAATEATLTTRATEATLASIKDTDGIKKITDPLPTGANTIGKVDQGTGGASAWKVDGSAVTQPVSGTVTGNQGTPAVVGNAWPVKVSDGVDTVGISTVAGDKALKVDVVQTTGAGGMGTSQADKSSFVEGTTSFTPIGGVFNETISSDPTEDQAAAARITAKRAVHTNLRDSSGTEVGTSGAPLRTDPTGTTTQPVSAVSLPLPTGAATEVTLAAVLADTADIETSVANLDVALSTRASEATLATRLAEATFTARINTLGQKVMASSTPVVVASDQSKIPVEGTGIAGTPAGGVLSIQGVVGGTPMPISGSITATVTEADVGLIGSPAPASGSNTAGIDAAGNLESLRVHDLDSGAGTEYNVGVSLRKSAGGGSVELGTSADPVRTDPTGTTTQPVSAVSLPLPTGAATEATLALIKAKTDNLDVALSTRAVTGLTDAQLRASAVPVSGTVTANVGTTGGLALDATLTGGTQKAIVRGGAKGATTAADVTSTAEGADHQALDVQLYHGGAAKDPTAIRALTAADVVTAAQGTAAAASSAWPTKISDGTDTVGISTVGGAKALKVDVIQTVGGGGTGVSQTDKSTFTEGTTAFTPVGGVYNETISSDPTEDQAAAARITAKRAVHTNLRNNSGTEVGTSGAPLRTDPTGTTAQPVTDNSGSLTVDTPQLPASLVGGRLDVVTTPATPTAAALTSASINASASGDNTLVAGTASQTVRIFRLFLVANDSVDIKFKDGAGTDLTPAMAMTKNGGMVLDMSGEPWFVTSASNGFLLNLSAAKQVSGRIYYTKS